MKNPYLTPTRHLLFIFRLFIQVILKQTEQKKE